MERSEHGQQRSFARRIPGPGLRAEEIDAEGSIGQRAHVLLPYVAGWRWMHEGDRSYWYDSLHLHRQRESGGWAWVLKHLTTLMASVRYN